MSGPWPIYPGPSIVCVSRCGCASGFAAIATAHAVSSLNACRLWPPPGRAVLCGWPSAWSRSVWRWVGQRVSRNPLLRLLRRQPEPDLPTSRVLGVDDWALRKGQTYRTVLIDLERRQPVALLPDRTAATLAQWLREQPGVQVIARDRATAYADGARHGVPAAAQVADRFHLLRNLAEAVEQVFHQHRRVLQDIHGPSVGLALADAAQPTVVEAPSPAPPATLLLPSAGTPPRHTYRRQRYERVCHLAQQGGTFRAIAQQVGLHRKTVAQYVRADRFPVWARPKSVLDPYKPYLLARWNAGCRTGMRLYEDLQRQGYRGGRLCWVTSPSSAKRKDWLRGPTRCSHVPP
jgi:DNA-binding NarL/FixJ family response regulator